MLLTKKFFVYSISQIRNRDMPIEITLKGFFDFAQEGILRLNQTICSQINIPATLNLTNQTITCVFESREFSPDPLATQDFGAQDLVIKTMEASWIKLCSQCEQLHFFQRPYFEFLFHLTPDEHGACRALPQNTVFMVRFSLDP